MDILLDMFRSLNFFFIGSEVIIRRFLWINYEFMFYFRLVIWVIVWEMNESGKGLDIGRLVIGDDEDLN